LIFKNLSKSILKSTSAYFGVSGDRRFPQFLEQRSVPDHPNDESGASGIFFFFFGFWFLNNDDDISSRHIFQHTEMKVAVFAARS
jgi:hypothetical protein